MTVLLRTCAVFLCGALLAGCPREKKEAPRADESPPRTLLIGLIPEQNVFRQLERYGPLAEHLSRKVGASIHLDILPRYGNIANNFVSRELDGAFFGSFTYALAHRALGVTVIARPVDLDDHSTYHGLIFVRQDSGIRTIKDMRGKRFVFVDKATTAGYLLPLDYFIRNGVKDYTKLLKEAYFSGTHEDAIYDVLNRRADIGAAKNTVFDRLARLDPRLRNELIVLEVSPDVPENGLALRASVPAPLRDAIQHALLTMHEDPEGREILRRFGAQRFIETSDEDYAPVYAYARELGLDLAKYDYEND